MGSYSESLSIVIPVYHAETEELKRCVFSIMEQELDNIEIIMVFDEPLDGYQSFIDAAEKQGVPLRCFSQEHLGVSAARNKGIREAVGKWLFFMDADDYLERGALASMLLCGENTQADLIMYEHCKEYGDKKEFSPYRQERRVFSGDSRQEFLKDILKPQTGAGFAWGKLYSGDMLRRSELKFREELSMAEDAEFVLRAACRAQKIVYEPRLCYHYCFSSDSAVRRYRDNYVDMYAAAMLAIREDLKKEKTEGMVLEEYYSCVLYHLLLIAVNYSFHPENPRSFREKRKAFGRLQKRPLFAEALKHVHLQDFSLSRKITLLFICMHFNLGVGMIAGVRHAMFRRRMRRTS